MIVSPLVRGLCLVGPLGLFVVVAGIGGHTIEAWRVNAGGLIVLTWTCIVTAWTLAVRKRLRLPSQIGIRRRYRRAFVASFIQQAFILFLASLLLDGGLDLLCLPCRRHVVLDAGRDRGRPSSNTTYSVRSFPDWLQLSGLGLACDRCRMAMARGASESSLLAVRIRKEPWSKASPFSPWLVAYWRLREHAQAAE